MKEKIFLWLNPNYTTKGIWKDTCAPMFISALFTIDKTWRKWRSLSHVWVTLCDPMNYTVHGILQARMLEWVAFPFSRRSSKPRDRTQVSCIAGGCFTSWATREAPRQDMEITEMSINRWMDKEDVMDLEITILSEVSQKEKDKYHMISLVCGL